MEKSKVYIYHIICIPTGKGYIGSTVNLHKRKSGHFEQLRKNKHYNQYLQNAFNKYGEENFTFEIIFSCCKNYRNKIEEWFINKSNYNSEFNLTLSDKRDYSREHNLKWFNKEDIEKIIELIKEGHGLEDLCKKMSISTSLMCNILKNKYYKDVVIPNEIIDLYQQNISKKRKSIQREKASEIYVYDINGNFINRYKSVPHIAEHLNFNKNSVMNALQRGIQLNGYLFYKQPTVFTKYIPNVHGTNLLVYDIDFNLIDSLKYMKKAQEKYNISINNINNSCNRLQLCNKQFYFVREKDKQKFEDKFNLVDKLSAFGETKDVLFMLDKQFGE